MDSSDYFSTASAPQDLENIQRDIREFIRINKTRNKRVVLVTV
jgi:hypothetical protein